MATEYRPAPAVRKIAEKLITKHHTHLADDGVRIEYVFRSDAAMSNGKTVLGKARKISGLNAFLSSDGQVETFEETLYDFFVIEIAEEPWSNMADEQREALVDHELMHCVTDYDEDDNLVLKMRAHDVEEFGVIIKRHGLWREDLDEFAESMAEAVQQKLNLGGE